MALAALALAAAASGALADRPRGGAKERRLAIFYTAEVHGALEPCGCTSDPMGDIARFAALVRSAGKEVGAALVVDAGGLLYPQTAMARKKQAAADLRAEFLAAQMAGLGVAGIALGETDLARGPERVIPGRLASNLAAPMVEAPRVQVVGGVRVGVIAVADPDLGRAHGWKAEEPAAAARRDAESLRQRGAEVVIALAPVDRPVALRLAREAHVDFVILGREVRMGRPAAEKVGRAWVLAPADELQKVGRLDLVLRDGGGPLADAGGLEASERRGQELDRAIAELEASLGRWATGGAGTDPAFVAAKREERAALAAEREKLRGEWRPPTEGSYFTNRLIPIRRSLPRDPKVAAAMDRLDARIGAANLRAAEPPVPAEPGRPVYVGAAKCVSCHAPAMAFWRRTVHARAWRTLVVDGKSADYDCVGCHATGFDEVGGSSLGHTRRLEDVQCETCHGPASLHVAEEGLEDQPTIRRDTPETTCLRCHNEKHSDTFQYEAYLRDVLGKGHGAEARKKLGSGPTGRELRAAALAKARAAGKAQLKRM